MGDRPSKSRQMYAVVRCIAIERGTGINLNEPWITPPES